VFVSILLTFRLVYSEMNRSNVDRSAESMFSVKAASNSTSIQFGEEVWYASLRASLEYWHEAVVLDGSELILVRAQALVIDGSVLTK
jgi:hypothetical protein